MLLLLFVEEPDVLGISVLLFEVFLLLFIEPLLLRVEEIVREVVLGVLFDLLTKTTFLALEELFARTLLLFLTPVLDFLVVEEPLLFMSRFP